MYFINAECILDLFRNFHYRHCHRPFFRKAEIDIQSYQFDTVFVDPPRAGIDDDTLKLLQESYLGKIDMVVGHFK